MSSFHTAHATWYLDVSLVSQNASGLYSTIRVTFYAIADSGWSGNASGIGFTVNTYGNGSFSFSGGSFTVYDGYYNVFHNAQGYAGTFTATAHANATGTSTYGGPVDLAQAISPPRIAVRPGAPGLSAATPVGRNVTINISIPAGYDEGGSSVQYLRSQYSKDGGAWTGQVDGGWGTRAYNNLAPGKYQFRALAHNAVGDSAWTTSNIVTVLSGGKVWTGTAWQAAIMKVWSGTAWVDATVKVWNGTAWAPAL